MEEQDDSRKRVPTEPPEVLRRVKRPTNGPIPKLVRNSDGDTYIVREFKEEMRGKKIWNMSQHAVETYKKMMWPARILLREDDPEYWRGVLRLFEDGVEVEGTGIWDAIENPVEILRWDNPDMYHGGDENKE
jgi:hypothetical protein